MSQPLNVITVASDGSVFGIDPQNNILQGAYGSALTPIAGSLTDVSASADGTIWGVASAGQVFSYLGGSLGWQSVPGGSAPVTAVSVGNSGNIWATDGSGNAYIYISGSGFTQLGSLASVSATSDGGAWGLNAQGAPQQFNAATKSWQAANPAGPEPFAALSAGTSGWVWALGNSGKVYQWDGTGNQWQLVTSELPIKIASLSCGDDGTVWALDTSGIAYSYSMDQQDWVFAVKLAGGALSVVSVADAGSIWAVDTSGNIYQDEANQLNWNTIGAAATQVNISAAAANNIWALDAQGNVYQNTAGPSTWNPVPIPGATLTAISAAADGTVFGLSNQGVVRYTTGGWDPVPCSVTLVAIAAGSWQNIWGLDASGNVYQYQGGSEWPQQPGALARIAAAADGSVWGLNSQGQAYMYTGSSWYPTATALKQIALGSATNIWGIDPSGDAVNVLAGATTMVEASSARLVKKPGSLLPAFDAENPFDEAQSTHLWIVNRAAQLAQGAPQYGSAIVQLLKPFQGQVGDPFHDNMCQGLYDADFLTAYNGPLIPKWVGTPTYASHFYDPDTGLNWLGDSDWTAVSQGQKLFWQALDAYLSGDLSTAGYNLGLALHYFTDLMQPMHAANFTYLSSWAPGYHTGFESYVMENQSSVTVPSSFVTSAVSANPTAFLINAAKNSKYKYYAQLCPSSITNNYSSQNGLTVAQQQAIYPLVQDILYDAIVFTSQYIFLWMSLAQGELANCQIVSAVSGMAIDVPGKSTSKGKQLQQYAWNNTSAQRFSITELTGADQGYVEIVALCSRLSLDAQNSTAENAPVVQNPWNGSDGQKWQLVQTDSAAVSIQNKYSGLFLTLLPPFSQQSSQLVQGTPESSGAQQWFLTPAAPVFIVLTQTQTQSTLTFDVIHGSSNPGTLIQIYNQNKSNSQTYLWVALGGDDEGYNLILNQASGLVISGASGRVMEDVWLDSDSEKWAMIPVSPGAVNFYIQNKGSGEYINVSTIQSGTPLSLSATAQSSFTFQAASLNLAAETPAPLTRAAGG